MLFLCYPKCSTCQKAKAFLDANTISYDLRDIKAENPTEEELRLLRAREILDTMTLEQKIGQLFFARCPGPNGDGEGLMAQYQLGGYLLFLSLIHI